jgi:hypothetical protein
MTSTTYHVIAYPEGARTIVGTFHGGSAEGVVWNATQIAKVYGEYLDVERTREGLSIGQCIAVVGAEGPVGSGHGYYV